MHLHLFFPDFQWIFRFVFKARVLLARVYTLPLTQMKTTACTTSQDRSSRPSSDSRSPTARPCLPAWTSIPSTACSECAPSRWRTSAETILVWWIQALGPIQVGRCSGVTKQCSFICISGQNSSTYYTFLDSTYGTKVKQINFEQIRNYGRKSQIDELSQQVLILGSGYFAEDNNLDEDTIEITAMYTNSQKPDQTEAWGTFLKYK